MDSLIWQVPHQPSSFGIFIGPIRQTSSLPFLPPSSQIPPPTRLLISTHHHRLLRPTSMIKPIKPCFGLDQSQQSMNSIWKREVHTIGVEMLVEMCLLMICKVRNSVTSNDRHETSTITQVLYTNACQSSTRFCNNFGCSPPGSPPFARR